MKTKLKDELQFHIRKISVSLWILIIVIITVIITLKVYEYGRLQYSFNQTVSNTLSKSLLENDLVQIRNISNGLTKANSSFELCLMYNDQLLFGESCSDETAYEAYNIPLKEDKLYIASKLNNRFQEYLIFIPFLIPILLVFVLISRQINKHCGFIEQDLENLLTVQKSGVFHFDEFHQAKRRLDELEEVKTNSLKLKVVNKISKQVAHDIKSPLAALEIVMEDIKNLPEEARDLTLHAINRIQEIANNLSKDGIDSNDMKLKDCLPSITVANIFNEKSIEYQNKQNISLNYNDNTSRRNFVKVNESEISRVLSNLINNSVESLKDSGSVNVDLMEEQDFLKIQIDDSGPGFPEEILVSGIAEGRTIDKDGGQGLGLHYAKTIIEKVGGKIQISNNSSGARVEITLPITRDPDWFKSSINLSKYKKVIIADDDRSIHDVWNKLIRKFNPEVEIQSVYFADEILQNFENLEEDTFIFLDYDLRQKHSGIDYIKRFSLSNVALVTSNYDTDSVVQYCIENGIQMIPKQIVSSIELV